MILQNCEMLVSYVISFAIIIPVYYLVPDIFGTENHSLIITHIAIFVVILVTYFILGKISVSKNFKSEQVWVYIIINRKMRK